MNSREPFSALHLFSGGMDSTMALACHLRDNPGARILALTYVREATRDDDLKAAKNLEQPCFRDFSVTHRFMDLSEVFYRALQLLGDYIDDKLILPCTVCRSIMYIHGAKTAKQSGIPVISTGARPSDNKQTPHMQVTYVLDIFRRMFREDGIEFSHPVYDLTEKKQVLHMAETLGLEPCRDYQGRCRDCITYLINRGFISEEVRRLMQQEAEPYRAPIRSLLLRKVIPSVMELLDCGRIFEIHSTDPR